MNMFRSDHFYLFFRLTFLNPNNNNCPEPLFDQTEQRALSVQSFANVFKLLVFYSEAPFVNQEFCIPAQLCQAT